MTLGTASSTWEAVLREVPEGSVVGPKLFNIFISDLVYTITQCRIISYMDDTNIHCSNKNVRAVVKDNLKSDLGNATAWFIQNGMKSNLQKSRNFQRGGGSHCVKQMVLTRFFCQLS